MKQTIFFAVLALGVNSAVASHVNAHDPCSADQGMQIDRCFSYCVATGGGNLADCLRRCITGEEVIQQWKDGDLPKIMPDVSAIRSEFFELCTDEEGCHPE